mgnify:CR=1 FL=1
MVTVVVSQSNYLPWKGYFDLVREADHLVLLETVQFTRRDWRSRNRIKSPDGVQWLSVPVNAPGGRLTSVSEGEISDSSWPQKHLRAIELSYRRTPHFEPTFGIISESLEAGDVYLSELNERILRAMLDHLGIELVVSAARGPIETVDASERILRLVLERGGTRYLSGPAAKSYLDIGLFTAAGIDVDFFEYPDYPEYKQLWPPFRHDVSMIDVLFHLGAAWPTALGVSG